jgi:ferredoxin
MELLSKHHIKRVEKPTSLMTANIGRIDCRENALNMAMRGDYGEAVKMESPRLTKKYPLSAAQFDLVNHLSTVPENAVSANTAPLPDDPELLSRHIKRLCYFLKADLAGICELPASAVYSHDIDGNPIDMDYKYAIVIALAKEYETVQASTGTDWIGDALSYQAYQRIALITETIANYIRRLGFPASAQHPPSGAKGGFKVLVPPLLLWAGMGEGSRAGFVLNPFLGLDFKAGAVLTNLPLEPDKPIDFGLQDFCRHCRICAEACPAKAIPFGDKIMYNGYETWKLDTRKCATFSILNKYGTICNTCGKVCPWTRPVGRPLNAVRWAVQKSGKWWFDLEDVDGTLVAPDVSD